MTKDRMVGARLPLHLVQELELIEEVEQSDRSTTVRRLLSKAIVQWNSITTPGSMARASLPWRGLRARPVFPCGR